MSRRTCCVVDGCAVWRSSAHAGAASITTVQTYSRLEHSLGVLALVAHVDPADVVARIAALLHDVGHLPLSRTFEGICGLDHHRIGVARAVDLSPVLEWHGINARDVLAVLAGRRRSVLRGPPGVLKLDQLDSLIRSGQAHRRLRQFPLRRCGASCFQWRGEHHTETAAYLTELVAGRRDRTCPTPTFWPTASYGTWPPACWKTRRRTPPVRWRS